MTPESITLDGTEITVTLPPPSHPDWRAMAAAAAVRILECYPVIDRVVLRWGTVQFSTTRAIVEQMLLPDGFAAVADRARWQDVVNRLVLFGSSALESERKF